MKRLLLFLIAALYIFSVQGQAGKFDGKFAGKGWTYVDMPKGNFYSETVHQLFLQKDGKYIVTFELNDLYTVLARYQPDGNRDGSYGSGGYSAAVNFVFSDAAQQSDGKIIGVGFKYNGNADLRQIVMARYNVDGSLDETFGTKGVLTTAIYGIEPNITIQSDEKIIVGGGFLDKSSVTPDLFLARFNTDGTIDKSFGSNGIVITDFGQDDRSRGLAIQKDGKIVVLVESADPYFANVEYRVVRYAIDGSLDKSFDHDGKRKIDFGGLHDVANALAIQEDQKILVAGSNPNETPNSGEVPTAADDFALHRYNSDGSSDGTFGSDGTVITDIHNSVDEVITIGIQADGKIIAAGRASINYTSDFALVRYKSNGMVDKSFGTDGKVITDISGNDEVTSMILQSDGKIVLAGTVSFDIGLARYNNNGSLDKSFSDDGKLRDFYKSGSGRINAMAVQKDGKVVVAGFSYLLGDDSQESAHFALSRFNPDGSLDTTFGNNGVVNTLLHGDDDIRSIAIQKDGKIIAAGVAAGPDGDNPDFALIRYNMDGSLDNSFGYQGKVITDLGDWEAGNSVAIQNDDKIVLAGHASGQMAILRYNPDGSLDKTFDGDGMLITDVDGSFTSLAIETDGRIVVAGRNSIVRVTPEGALDKTFNGDGKVIIDVSDFNAATSVVIQPDHKIVVGGYTSNVGFTQFDIVLVRYNEDGSLDKGFNGNGKVITNFRRLDVAEALVIQSDGKLIAGGGSSSGGNYEFVITRYNPEGSLDKSFSEDGRVTKSFGGSEVVSALYIDHDRLYVAGNSSSPTARGVLAAVKLGCIEQVFYRDLDRDSYGDITHKVIACSKPDGYVVDSTDCNDNNANVHPGAKEICDNGIDDNCNGHIDEGCPDKPFIYVMPNPSSSYFTLNIQSNVNSPATLTVTDEMGRLVETKTGIKLNSSIQIGHHYQKGVYYVKVIQGTNIAVLRLMKTSN